MTTLSSPIHKSSVYAEKIYTTFEWTLQDYSSLEEYYGKGIKSPSFEIADTNKTCRLTYLHTTKQEVFVNVSFPHDVNFHTLKIDISIIDEIGKTVKSVRTIVAGPLLITSVAKHATIFTNSLINAPDILTTRGCLCNDALTLVCKLTIIKNVIKTLPVTTVRVPCLSDEARNKFIEFLEKQSLCDVVFFVKGKEFYGHKVVIAASSSIFETMFDTKTKENLENTVIIEDVEADIFEAFLKYIYTGSIVNMEKKIQDLFVVADKYEVKSLRKTCEDYMKNDLRCANCIEYLVFAHIYKLNNLKERALAIVMFVGKELTEFEDFHILCNYPNLMSEIFRKIAS